MGNCLQTIDPILEAMPKSESIDMTPLKNRDLIIIIIYGGPGSGRATQSNLISQKYEFLKLSCPELLRNEIATGSNRGLIIAKIMKEGFMVPAEIVLSLIQEKMLATFETAKGFVIDGYPREKAQAIQFDEKILPPHLIIYLVVDKKLLSDRCQGRAVTSGRSGDTIEVIERRIKYFNHNCKGIINYYKNKIAVIDGAQDINTVFNDICNVINVMINNRKV